jgi:hypothetical protein
MTATPERIVELKAAYDATKLAYQMACINGANPRDCREGTIFNSATLALMAARGDQPFRNAAA